MAKRNREQAVREKRELKLAKKHAAAAARNAPPEDFMLTGPLAEGFNPNGPLAPRIVDGNGTPPAEEVPADTESAEGVIDDPATGS
ncbi:MAG: hypothetical protein ABI896_06575 [Actinomycetota bacterium]